MQKGEHVATVVRRNDHIDGSIEAQNEGDALVNEGFMRLIKVKETNLGHSFRDRRVYPR